MGKDVQITVEGMIEAFAKSLVAFKEAEDRFKESPNMQSAWAYHRALDTMVVLRDEVMRANRFGDALAHVAVAERSDEIVKRPEAENLPKRPG